MSFQSLELRPHFADACTGMLSSTSPGEGVNDGIYERSFRDRMNAPLHRFVLLRFLPKLVYKANEQSFR